MKAGSLFSGEIQTRGNLACCDKHSISCNPFRLDTSVLGDQDLHLSPLNTTLSFEGMVDGNSNSFHYGNEHVDFILTLNPKNNGVYGHASLDDGNSYVIEYCGNGIHALKHLDVSKLEQGVGEDYVDEGPKNKTFLLSEVDYKDSRSIKTYSVKFYYTPQFAATTSDIETFIEQVIQETNQGYINSRVSLRVKAFCSEKSKLNDNSNSAALLTAFKNMKGSTGALRGSADVAVLLTGQTMGNVCGRAYLDTIASGATVSVCAKQCALGYYSFGHEIGHNIGLGHNNEVYQNPYFRDGHGHLIAQGSANTGARTILAYYANGHGPRVNYYSNPSVNHPITRTPTGVNGLSNNARIMNMMSNALSMIGDEKSSCSDSFPSGTTSCAVAGEKRYFRKKWFGRQPESVCRAICNAREQCIAWNSHNRSTWCHIYEARIKSSRNHHSGPALTKDCFLDKSSCVMRNRQAKRKFLGKVSCRL